MESDLTPERWGLNNVSLIKVPTSDGLELNAWYAKAKNNKPTFLYFHGNRGHLGYRASLIKPYIDQGYGMLLIAYRGYSGNLGSPSEQGLYTDGRAGIEFLLKQNINSECIVLYTESLGSAVAIQIATEYQVGALILRSVFGSLVEVAKYYYPIFPVSLFLKDRFDSDNKIGKISAPMLFIHGADDKIIPMWMAEKLYNKVKAPKQFKVYQDGSHNFLPDFSPVVIDFLNHNNICLETADNLL